MIMTVQPISILLPIRIHFCDVALSALSVCDDDDDEQAEGVERKSNGKKKEEEEERR